MSNGNTVITPQFEQMTINENLTFNLSMLDLQHEDKMTYRYENRCNKIMQTPLSCYGNLLYVKMRPTYCSLLEISELSYGPTASSWNLLDLQFMACKLSAIRAIMMPKLGPKERLHSAHATTCDHDERER